jgi:biotin transport system substrate-specific component
MVRPEQLPGGQFVTTAPTVPTPVLADHLWRGRGFLRSAALVAIGSLALAISAKIQVPFWPVPITMQSLVVLLIGLAYGSRLGAATVLAYLVEGLAGLPVFAGLSAGPAYMMGPTGGYLLGFLLAAAFVGWLAERGWDRTLGGTAAALVLGHVVLFIPGVIWLAILFGWPRAIALGVTPFIAATIVKTALGIALIAAVRSLIGNRLSTRR